MQRYIIQYTETYSRCFYVEAESSDKATELVEDFVENSNDDIFRNIGCDSVNYQDVTKHTNPDKIDINQWERNLDIVQED